MAKESFSRNRSPHSPGSRPYGSLLQQEELLQKDIEKARTRVLDGRNKNIQKGRSYSVLTMDALLKKWGIDRFRLSGSAVKKGWRHRVR